MHTSPPSSYTLSSYLPCRPHLRPAVTLQLSLSSPTPSLLTLIPDLLTYITNTAHLIVVQA